MQYCGEISLNKIYNNGVMSGLFIAEKILIFIKNKEDREEARKIIMERVNEAGFNKSPMEIGLNQLYLNSRIS